MGLFDKIKQSVSDTVSDISSQAESTLRKAKVQTSEIATKVSTTASELAAEGAKSVGQGLSSLGQSISDAGNGDYTGLRNIASATGDFIIETTKDMPGINTIKSASEIVNSKDDMITKGRKLLELSSSVLSESGCEKETKSCDEQQQESFCDNNNLKPKHLIKPTNKVSSSITDDIIYEVYNVTSSVTDNIIDDICDFFG